MMARYGITLAKDMAEKVDISLAVVKLDFEDRWQYGPLENLRKQLKEISQGNRPYLVFIDEMDTKIPTRSNGENGYRKDIIGEFLRFRGGDYINNGNYLIIGTTNEPNKIDQAITSVFQIEELQGPKTKEEKTKVLYNNLKEGINQGYVQISDWKNIGEALEEYNLTGVNIVNIARNSKQKFRAIASKISFSGTATQKEIMIAKVLKNNGADYMTREKDVMQSILNEVRKEVIATQSYISEATKWN